MNWLGKKDRGWMLIEPVGRLIRMCQCVSFFQAVPQQFAATSVVASFFISTTRRFGFLQTKMGPPCCLCCPCCPCCLLSVLGFDFFGLLQDLPEMRLPEFGVLVIAGHPLISLETQDITGHQCSSLVIKLASSCHELGMSCG